MLSLYGFSTEQALRTFYANQLPEVRPTQRPPDGDWWNSAKSVTHVDEACARLKAVWEHAADLPDTPLRAPDLTNEEWCEYEDAWHNTCGRYTGPQRDMLRLQHCMGPSYFYCVRRRVRQLGTASAMVSAAALPLSLTLGQTLNAIMLIVGVEKARAVFAQEYARGCQSYYPLPRQVVEPNSVTWDCIDMRALGALTGGGVQPRMGACLTALGLPLLWKGESKDNVMHTNAARQRTMLSFIYGSGFAQYDPAWGIDKACRSLSALSILAAAASPQAVCALARDVGAASPDPANECVAGALEGLARINKQWGLAMGVEQITFVNLPCPAIKAELAARALKLHSAHPLLALGLLAVPCRPSECFAYTPHAVHTIRLGSQGAGKANYARYNAYAQDAAGVRSA
ncbi:ORF31 [Ranid herpesvirus 1]|uniref:ORF31 n=1 Tax=Ranid herpesvirus 1 TaxID=85655 RepID=Q14VS7_9VIRU|nr:ORF31 [Ranid herpesvirus 1]ABG25740.1 ORF31 [Ranid herpesvirus 1]